jgi:hypothetical protein
MPSQNVEPLEIATGEPKVEVTHWAGVLEEELPQLAVANEAPALLSSRTRKLPVFVGSLR